MKSENTHTEINGMFWAHLFVTSLQWIGPILFWWPLMLIAYGMVQLQYNFFGRCLMNEGHALEEADHNTFYHYLLTKLGLDLDKKTVKFVVRERLNFFLGLFTLIWQLVLGFAPLISFVYYFNKLDFF